MHFSTFISLALASVAFAAPLSPDPAGAKNVGNGAGQQFITGECLSNADCNSGCCATLGNLGICSGPAVSTAQGKSGCGFGGGAAAPPPPQQVDNGADNQNGNQPPPAAGGSGLKVDPSGEKNVGNGNAGQFIGGECLADADCASGCCATLGNQGICSAELVAFAQGKSGCGFGGGGAAAPPAEDAPVNNAGNNNANNNNDQAPPAAGSGLKPDPAGDKNIGNGQGLQFITGQCLSNADCGSGCCATLGDIGICSGPAVSTAQGKSGCGFTERKRSLGGVF